MAKSFKNLRDKMSHQAQKVSEEKAKKMLSEMLLQERIAEVLPIKSVWK